MENKTIKLITSMKKKCEFLSRDLGKLEKTLEEEQENDGNKRKVLDS